MPDTKRSLRSTPLWLIALVGSCLTALGVYVQANDQSTMSALVAGTLAALGGGVVGAALSIYVSGDEGRSVLRAVQDLVSDSQRAQMRSAELDLRPIRKRWHYYHLTQRRNRYVWRHADYPLDQGNADGLLEVTVTDVNQDREHMYRAEVAVRGDRMILVESRIDGSEPPIVAMVPFFTEMYRTVHAGVAVVRTWDGTDILTKCLWSTTALVASQGPDVTDDESVELDRIWAQAFSGDSQILPAATDVPADMPGARNRLGPSISSPMGDGSSSAR